MSQVVVPLTPNANQTFNITLPVDGGNLKLTLGFTYNGAGQYWWMSITDSAGSLLLDVVPLVTGDYPAANLLKQYSYLNIGSAYIVPASNNLIDNPDFTNLGTDYVLVWNDTQTG